eukprot:g41.t1
MTSTSSSYPMIPVDEALQIILSACSRSASIRNVDVLQSSPSKILGLIIASDIIAPEDLPPFPASMMDGYAVVASDGIGKFPVVAKITAGRNPDLVLTSGKIAYITTGAALPKGADAVVQIEHTKASLTNEVEVEILQPVARGKWVRAPGSDISKGQKVLEKGNILGVAEVGLLAQIGLGSSVPVYKRPCVGVLSTGDELVPASTKPPLSNAMIRDSNRPMLLAAASDAGAEAIDLGLVKDETQSLRGVLLDAFQRCDIIVTSGGVSMGSLDLVKPTLEKLGNVHFGRLCMKPGKPTTFATIEIENGTKKFVFALPGNPVSSLVTFQLLVVPAIRRLAGFSLSMCHHAQLNVRTAMPLRLDPVRPEYHRAILTKENNTFVATSTGLQRSSRLLSMQSANALLCLPKADGALQQGTVVKALLLGRGSGSGSSISAISPPNEPIKHTSMDSIILSSSLVPVDVAGGEKVIGASGGCPCCAEKAKKRAAKAQLGPPPTEGGSLNVGGDAVNFGVLTVSDRASRGEYSTGDLCAPEVLRFFSKYVQSKWNSTVEVVPDDRNSIEQTLISMVDEIGCNVIITCGGTGPAKRDVTPEVTETICDRILPGFGEQMRRISMDRWNLQTSVLSRQTAGTRGDAIIINLPGAPEAVEQLLPTVWTATVACVAMLSGKSIISSKISKNFRQRKGEKMRGNGEETRVCTVDAANVLWINEKCIETVYERMMTCKEQAIKSQEISEFIFKKKRGCFRKKKKEKTHLKMPSVWWIWLESQVEKYQLPNWEKALRIVLDYLMEETE